MADRECIALAELRAALESGEPGLPEQWRAAFGSVKEAATWAGKNHPNPAARGLFMAVSQLGSSFDARRATGVRSGVLR